MDIDYKAWIAGIRQEISEISVAELAASLEKGAVIIDVRESDEFEQGAIPGAHLIPRGQLEGAIGEQVTDPETPVVLYCAVGERSALAAQSLTRLGYQNVRSLKEGFDGWKQAGRPWTVPSVLPADQRARYSRHLLLPEVGRRGPAAAAGIQGPGGRCRWTGISGRVVSRGCGCRHPRHRGFRRG